MRCVFQLAVVATLVLTISGCTWSSQQRAERVQVVSLERSTGGAVHINSRNGSVEIAADPSVSSPQISATLYCTGETMEQAQQRVDQATVRAEFDASGALVIEPVFPGEKPQNGDGASFVIKVAAADGVVIDTSNGRVNVRGSSGELRIDTSNGSVTVNDHHGPAHIDTSNGRVEVNRVLGSVTIDTSNQTVTAMDVRSPVIIETSNGSITVALAEDQAGPISLDTSNGNIKARVGHAFVGTVTMDTSNGSVRVNDRAGRVTSSTVQRSSGVVQIGTGGDASTLDSSNGSIELTIGG